MKRKHIRNAARIEIIRQHMEVFKMAYPEDKLSDWKSEIGRKIIHIMRTKLGYSVKTTDCDIYRNAFFAYRETFLDGFRKR